MPINKSILAVRPVAVAFLAFTSVSGGAAEHVAETESKLDEIVVSATRIDSSIRKTARSVSVINQDDIQSGRQQLALDEALAGVPGLYMQNRYNFAQDLRMSLRGFGARSAFGIRGIKVIVDGIPETLPDGQASVDSIDLGSTRRIEVLRGPSSSLYGNAAGGVIAIESERGTERPFVAVGLAGGDDGYAKYQVKVGGESGRINYLVNVSRQEIDGYREHSRAKGTLLNSRFEFRLGELDTLTIVLNHTDQPVADDPGGVSFLQALSAPRSARDRNLEFDAGEALQQQRLGLVYETDRFGGNLRIRNYYAWRDFQNKLPFTDGGSVNLERFFSGFGVQYSFDNYLPVGFNLTAGVDVERQDDERRRFDNLNGTPGALVFDQNEKVDGGGAYIHGSFQINERWSVSGGLRYDEISFDVVDRFISNGDDSGTTRFEELSSSFGVQRETNNGTLFASYGESFETPTTTELANPDGSGGFNQRLNPQTASSVEIGWKTGTANRYTELAVFNIKLRDELVPLELAASPGRTFFTNAGKSSRSGVEFAYSWSGKNGFGVDVSYTYSDFKFDDFVDQNGIDFAGSRLPGLPEHFGHVALRYENPNGLRVSFDNSYSGQLFANNANSVKVSGYHVSGLRLGRSIERGKWQYNPYLGLNNLFNVSYNNNIRINAFGGRYFEAAPARNLYVGISVRYLGSI